MRIHVQISNLETKSTRTFWYASTNIFSKNPIDPERKWRELPSVFLPNSDHEQQNYKYPGTTMDPSIERRSEWNLEESPLDKGDDKSILSMQNRDTFIPDISKKIAFEASRGTKQRS